MRVAWEYHPMRKSPPPTFRMRQTEGSLAAAEGPVAHTCASFHDSLMGAGWQPQR